MMNSLFNDEKFWRSQNQGQCGINAIILARIRTGWHGVDRRGNIVQRFIADLPRCQHDIDFFQQRGAFSAKGSKLL
jgi:hypothetical protein